MNYRKNKKSVYASDFKKVARIVLDRSSALGRHLADFAVSSEVDPSGLGYDRVG